MFALDNGTERKEINIYAVPGTAALIPIRIKNGNSISGLSNTYRLSGGNLANAVVELGANGIGLNNQNKDYDLGSNELLNLVNGSGQDLLYVKQNPNSNALSYEGIEILLTPTCEEELEEIFD